MRVAELTALPAEAVVVAPAHQFPTGAVMAAGRRIALVEWAAQREGLVIEDDYDAEFRYDRAPVGAIQGLDPGRVAHVGTASKTLVPGVRLGWISAPSNLVDALCARKSAADSGSPVIDQLALAELLSSGEYEHHIIRVRSVYRRRRDLLVESLRRHLPELQVQGAAAGMQLLLPPPDTVDDLAIAQLAASRGINVMALSPCHLGQTSTRGLLLGYGRLPEIKIPLATDALLTVPQGISGTHVRAGVPMRPCPRLCVTVVQRTVTLCSQL